MQRETNRFVIGRENNVVRVDFSRDPDPPAPRFPVASGLREIGDEAQARQRISFLIHSGKFGGEFVGLLTLDDDMRPRTRSSIICIAYRKNKSTNFRHRCCDFVSMQ
jgi:hypothetical protein